MESCQVLFLFVTVLNALQLQSGVVAFSPLSSPAFRSVQFSRPIVGKPEPQVSSSASESALQNSNSNASEGDGNDNAEESSSASDLSWMKKAMGASPEGLTPKESLSPPLKSGISGFAVDKDVGFVCVLVPETDDEDEDEDDESDTSPNRRSTSTRNGKFTYAIVSPTDKERLSSAEGLCLVQLAGGLDLGAAVFPPETLARVVAAELIHDDEENDDDDDDEEEINVEELRTKVTLLGVTAVKNDKYSPKEKQSDDSNMTNGAAGGSTQSSPERDAKIEEGSPNMLPAIRNLPGLAEITTEQIISAMQIHADANGKLDRQGFSELLGTLRGGNALNRMDDQKVKFRITASILEDGDSSSPSKLVDVDHVPAFQAIALALRYKVTVSVSEGCFDNDDDDEKDQDILSRFPLFKPAQELEEDAQVMDGGLSNMFFKKKAPGNDDKV
jgi:hypothetical protein